MSLFQDLEDEVIADIARRVKKTGRYTETAELMAKHMREQGYSPAKIQAEVMKYLRADKDFQMAVAENTKAYKEEVREIIKKTVAEAKKAGDELIAEAGDMAWNEDLSMWSEKGVDLKRPNSMSQLKAAFAAQTANELKNLTRSTGFKNANSGTVGVANAYQRELDLALLKVATGTFSYDQAVQDCVHRLAESGLRSINYESGRAFQLDTAVRMCVRTGCSQLSGRIMEANLESTGQDLVITSQHMGSRPEHAPWQNKVFSYSGKSRKYPDFFKETGYGTAAGLKGVNCTHDFYPFWEGASVIPEDIKEPDPVMIDGKEYTYYQATQKQRSMERDIRALKREINACEALDMDSAELQSRLKMKTAEYRKFSDSANLKPKNNRLKVVRVEGVGNDSADFFKGAKKRVEKAIDKMNEHEPLKFSEWENTYKKDILSVIDDAPTSIKKILSNFDEHVRIVNENSMQKSRSGKRGISFNAAKDKNNTRGKWTAIYHEIGHSIDRASGRISVRFPEFGENLKKDFEKLVEQWEITYNVDRETAYIELSKILKTSDKFHSVSDLIGGITNNVCVGNFLHDTQYWNGKNALQREAFAHFFEAVARADVEKIEIVKGIFPEAFKTFEGMLEILAL